MADFRGIIGSVFDKNLTSAKVEVAKGIKGTIQEGIGEATNGVLGRRPQDGASQVDMSVLRRRGGEPTVGPVAEPQSFADGFMNGLKRGLGIKPERADGVQRRPTGQEGAQPPSITERIRNGVAATGLALTTAVSGVAGTGDEASAAADRLKAEAVVQAQRQGIYTEAGPDGKPILVDVKKTEADYKASLAANTVALNQTTVAPQSTVSTAPSVVAPPLKEEFVAAATSSPSKPESKTAALDSAIEQANKGSDPGRLETLMRAREQVSRINSPAP